MTIERSFYQIEKGSLISVIRSVSVKLLNEISSQTHKFSYKLAGTLMVLLEKLCTITFST